MHVQPLFFAAFALLIFNNIIIIKKKIIIHKNKKKKREEEMLCFLLILIYTTTIVYSSSCSSPSDRKIHQEKGSTFPTLFRSFGGLFVSKASYEETIVNEVGLSSACAACYGAAYICGFNNCKLKCYLYGSACDLCLKTYDCSQTCNKCTGI